MTTEIPILPSIRLRPSLKKWIPVLCFSAVLLTVGLLMIVEGEAKGWYVTGVFALGLLAAPIHIFTSKLELNHKGFKICTYRKTTFYAWDEVQDISSMIFGLNKIVAFNFSAKSTQHKTLRKIASHLSGMQGALPDNYGMDAQDLALLMSQYQKNFLAHLAHQESQAGL